MNRSKKSTKIFSRVEELDLLKNIKEIRQSHCQCVTCVMDHLKDFVYEEARRMNKPYPKSWNKNRQATLEWLKSFEERHDSEMRIRFWSTCEAETIEKLTSKQDSSYKEIFTFEEESEILKCVIEFSKENLSSKNVLMKEIAIEAYKTACEFKKSYPVTWNMSKQAGCDWLKGFEERHKDEILKTLSSFKPKSPEPMSSSGSSAYIELFTLSEEEKLLTNVRLQKRSCHCRGCIMKEISAEAYKILPDEEMNFYPKLWNTNKQMGHDWMKGFEERHADKMSQLSPTCTVESQEPKSPEYPFTDEEAKMLLKHVQAIKEGCKCIHCIMEAIAVEAYKMVVFKGKKYPGSWDIDKQAGLDWVKGFAARHESKILQLAPSCEAAFPELMPSPRSSLYSTVFTFSDEEILLVSVLSKKKGCQCRECILKEIPAEAYKRAYNCNKKYPESWDIDKQAGLDWLSGFTARHENQILQLSPKCRNVKVFTYSQEEMLLASVKAKKKDCRCRGCIMKEIPARAYKRAYKLNVYYPESWNTFRQAGSRWLKAFAKRHTRQILAISPFCKANCFDVSTIQQSSAKVIFTLKEEFGLLEMTQVMALTGQCDCRSCAMQILEAVIYQETVRENKPYPKSWDIRQAPDHKWLNQFVKRHCSAIAAFSDVCRIPTVTKSGEE
ncbi:PREDICTED: uncharacterized protein LOC105560067 isoform X2 [Vollenhovia emeryi]|nr:PREDICTED: uncharacterized protein LOC105560067 isoform X2 [Vollenhovia emeryi]